MAEPSYHPLSPLKDPIEGPISLFSEQPLKEHSDPPRQLFRRNPSVRHQNLWRTVKTPLQMALLPLVAIGYLAFCYSVHGKVVPVNTYGLYAITPQHLATIKGGITSISIIVISIALYPVTDIISKLKSEEFFRVLTSQNHGVPLETINYISTPTFAHIDMIMAMWKHRCSNYYMVGIVASLVVWITATLAPGTLTVDSVLTDGELMAFAIGAVPAQSVFNGTDPSPFGSNASSNSQIAAAIAWAEMELNVQYSFRIANTSAPDHAAYIAPIPLDLSTTTSARWLSDVVGINPMCSWASTNLTAPVQISSNSTSDFNQYFATAYLADFNLDVQLTADDFPLSDSSFAIVKDPTSSVTNHSTQASASDGSTVFLLANCESGCTPFSADVVIDLTDVNTTFTINLTDQTWTMALLACIPNATIETREVRNDGHGVFSVQPSSAGRRLTHQGNLNAIQTTALFSITTMSLTQEGGKLPPSLTQYSSLGSQAQTDVLFGNSQINSLPANPADSALVTVSPAPINDITQRYTLLLQSATKSYLAGYLGKTYVPGRVSASELVFAASIPNLAVSSAAFAVLLALVLLAHFRQGKDVEFTLSNIAAAVHGSELPAQFAQIKSEHMAGGYRHTDEEAEGCHAKDGKDGSAQTSKVDSAESDATDHPQDIMEAFGQRRIFVQRRADGSPVLHMS